jgi:xanthine dehydrogenase YagS FAD-binding subunit
VALGASIDLTDGKDKRTVKLEEFFTLPTVDVKRENQIKEGELLTQINVPAPSANTRSFYIKQGEKESFDWPIAEVAVVLEKDGNTCKKASVVLGAAAPVPHRAKDVEAALAGKEITRENILAGADAELAKATPLALNKYKIPLLRNLIARTVLMAAGNEAAGAGGTQS